MGMLWQDIRYGLRMLGKSPGFTAVALLVVGVGIGANTALFNALDQVYARPLPVKKPHDTDSEKFLRGGDSVILRRSRRISPSKMVFPLVAAEILHGATLRSG